MKRIRIYKVVWIESRGVKGANEECEERMATTGDVSTIIESFINTRRCVDIVSIECEREVDQLAAVIELYREEDEIENEQE